MIPIFDLDDTLYDELEFVRSGLLAVAKWGHKKFGWDIDESYKKMLSILEDKGRGHVFDDWLEGNGSVREAVKIYRHHKPSIKLWKEAENLLNTISNRNIYLVTDGHKIVQANKIKALGITPLFQHCYITHRYGIAHAKPSTYCFELIKKREGCEWKDMAYIGDNPSKDFVNLNPLGVKTIRVRTGQHAKKLAKRNFDAICQIPDLKNLLPLI